MSPASVQALALGAAALGLPLLALATRRTSAWARGAAGPGALVAALVAGALGAAGAGRLLALAAAAPPAWAYPAALGATTTLLAREGWRAWRGLGAHAERPPTGD